MGSRDQLSYNAFPPHRILSPAKPISPATALAHIQSYLGRADSDASLHPDAILDKNGPQFARHASDGGLVLQLLRRVERGLDGERIVADLPGAHGGLNIEIGDVTSLVDAGSQHMGEQQALQADQTVERSYNEQMNGDTDLEGDVVGEIGERSSFVRDLQSNPAAAITNGGKKRKLDQIMDTSKMSKVERKRAKKERQIAQRQTKYAANEQKNEQAMQTDSDVDMYEVPVKSADVDDDDIANDTKATDTVVQNAPPANKETKKLKAERAQSEQRRADKKAQKAAKKRAAQELNGESTEKNSHKKPVADDHENERGKTEVVNKYGRDVDLVNTDGGKKKTKQRATDGSGKKKRDK